MAKAAVKSKSEVLVGVYRDFNSHTCIKLDEVDGIVKFIPLEIEGFDVKSVNASDFNSMYSLMPNYPIEKACGLYLTYAKTLGATQAAVDGFARFINVPMEDKLMATSKRREKTESATAVSEAKKASRQPKESKEAKPTKAKPAKEVKTKKEPKGEAGKERPTASKMFMDLIMEGKLSDDQIFAQVQVAFGLDDKKKGYVNWYRNKLKKDGKNPPARKA